MFPSNGAKNVNPDTHLVLTFEQEPVIGQTGLIRIFDAADGTLVDSLDLSIPAGPTASRQYGPECDYTKIPYDYARDFMPTNRNTLPGTPSGTAEPTSRDFQLTIIGGFTDAFHFHPIIVHGNTATIYPHNNMLEYGHSYFVTMDESVLNLPDSSFTGIQGKKAWKFSTKAQAPEADADTLVVDCSGNGDFNTVQGALDFIPDFSEKPVVIYIQPGDYEEIVYARNKSHVTLMGAGKDLVRIHYPNNEVFNPHPMTVKTNEWPGTFPSRRAAFMLDNCNHIVMSDMTVATDLRGQAEGLLLNGTHIALYRVHIIGSGDALQANGTIYMENCELDGGGDSILGRGSLFAYHCDFRNDGGPFTWVRNTDGHHGDVFVECTFSSNTKRMVDYGRCHTNHGTSYPYAEVVVINCKVKNLNPMGWSAIGEPTANMLEFNTRDMDSGELVDVSMRHPYSRQLNAENDADLIKAYCDPAFVLAGWNPKAE